MRAADGHEMVFLNVAEIDESGRAKSTTSFDEDALDDAIDELNERYLAGEGASRAADLETGRQYSARLNAGDWDGLRPLVTEDFEVVDTRRLSWPTLGLGEFVEAHESYDDQIAQHTFQRCVHLRGNAGLSTSVNIGVDAEGGEFEWVFHTLATFSADHRIERMELFDENDFATALARLDELGAAIARSPSPMVRERGDADRRRGSSHLAIDGRFDEAAEYLTPDIVRVDHRTAVSDADDAAGRDEYMAGPASDVRGRLHVGDRRATSPYAASGSRCSDRRSRPTPGCSCVIRSVGESDADGRVSSLSLFDEDALDDAVAELEARYAAGEGRPHAEILAVGADGHGVYEPQGLDSLPLPAQR